MSKNIRIFYGFWFDAEKLVFSEIISVEVPDHLICGVLVEVVLRLREAPLKFILGAFGHCP